MRFQNSCSDIVDEKFPIGRSPFFPCPVLVARDPMETDAVASDEIEFLFQIRQRHLRRDPRNDATNAEKLSRSLKERIFVSIEAESFMTEQLADVEKVTSAASEIENAQRWRAIEPKVLHMFDIDADPVRCVFVGVDPSRVGPIGIMVAQAL